MLQNAQKSVIYAKEEKYTLRIYSLLFAIILIDPLFSFLIPSTTLLRSCELVCLFSILYYEYSIFQINKLKYINGFSYGLFIILATISISIIIRGHWPTNLKDIGLHILSPTTIYLLPFFILPLPNRKYFKELLHLFFKISLIVIPIWFIHSSELVQKGTFKGESIGAFLPFISAFILGLGSYFNKKQKYATYTIWGIYFILMLLNARRNVSFSLALYALIAYLFSIRNELKKNLPKFILILLASILAFQILLLNLDSLTRGTFQNMANRAKEDTRSGIEELFFIDFMKSPIEDWIFGRGMDGGYYKFTIDKETGEISDNRTVIETGYLHLMLKGGIIYDIIIIMFIFISLSRVLKSTQKTLQYIGVILSTYLVDLYTTNPVCIYSVRSILFWFLISICIQSSNKTNRKRIFKNSQYISI